MLEITVGHVPVDHRLATRRSTVPGSRVPRPLHDARRTVKGRRGQGRPVAGAQGDRGSVVVLMAVVVCFAAMALLGVARLGAAVATAPRPTPRPTPPRSRPPIVGSRRGRGRRGPRPNRQPRRTTRRCSTCECAGTQAVVEVTRHGGAGPGPGRGAAGVRRACARSRGAARVEHLDRLRRGGPEQAEQGRWRPPCRGTRSSCRTSATARTPGSRRRRDRRRRGRAWRRTCSSRRREGELGDPGATLIAVVHEDRRLIGLRVSGHRDAADVPAVADREQREQSDQTRARRRAQPRAHAREPTLRR